MYSFQKKIRYANLSRLFSVVLYACKLGAPVEYLIRKRTNYNFASLSWEKRQLRFYAKLDHEMLRNYFGGKFMAIRFFYGSGVHFSKVPVT